MSSPPDCVDSSIRQALFITRNELIEKARKLEAGEHKKDVDFLEQIKSHGNVLVITEYHISAEKQLKIMERIPKLAGDETKRVFFVRSNSAGQDDLSTARDHEVQVENRESNFAFYDPDTNNLQGPGAEATRKPAVLIDHEANFSVNGYNAVDNGEPVPWQRECEHIEFTETGAIGIPNNTNRALPRNSYLPLMNERAFIKPAKESLWLDKDHRDPLPPPGEDYPTPPGWIIDNRFENLTWAGGNWKEVGSASFNNGQHAIQRKSFVDYQLVANSSFHNQEEESFRMAQAQTETGNSATLKRKFVDSNSTTTTTHSELAKKRHRAKAKILIGESNVNPNDTIIGKYHDNDINESRAAGTVSLQESDEGDLVAITGRMKKVQGPGFRWIFQIKTGSAASQPYWLRQPKILKIYGALAGALLYKFDTMYPSETQPDIIDVSVSPSKPIPAMTVASPSMIPSNVVAGTSFVETFDHAQSMPTFIHGRRNKVQGSGRAWLLLTEHCGEHSLNCWQSERELERLYGDVADEFIQRLDEIHPKEVQEANEDEYLYFDTPFKV